MCTFRWTARRRWQPAPGPAASRARSTRSTSPRTAPPISRPCRRRSPGCSRASAARLVDVLGRWLSVLVLIAAFAVASLLTMAAVSRRVAEFGTLKALGWSSRRIVAQVLGESVTVGAIGAALGVGLGFAGAAIIDALAPRLPAVISSPTGQNFRAIGPGGVRSLSPTATHTVAVPLSASVTAGAVVLGVVLAVIGGLLAGSLGGWRIARLRPADALTRVA